MLVRRLATDAPKGITITMDNAATRQRMSFGVSLYGSHSAV